MRRALRERIYLTASEVLKIVFPYIKEELGHIPERGLVKWTEDGEWYGFLYEYGENQSRRVLHLEDYLMDFIGKAYDLNDREDAEARREDYGFCHWLGLGTRKQGEVLKPGDEPVFCCEVPLMEVFSVGP